MKHLTIPILCGAALFAVAGCSGRETSVSLPEKPQAAVAIKQPESVPVPATDKPENRKVTFTVVDYSARWAVRKSETQGDVVSPEVRFRVVAKPGPVASLKIKVVYIEKKSDAMDVLDEVHQTVVDSSSPLEPGFAKSVTTYSNTGYTAGIWEKGETIDKDVSAVVYYDIGDGWVKLNTVAVDKKAP